MLCNPHRFMESSLGCKVEILIDSEKAGERVLSTLRLKDYIDAKAELERLDSEIAEKKAQLNEILRQEHEARERLAELVCSAETLPSFRLRDMPLMSRSSTHTQS